jgi:HK97 family phage major capsid protein
MRPSKLTGLPTDLPRALLCGPRAESSDVRAIVSQLNGAFEEFKARHNDALDEVNERLAGFYLNGTPAAGDRSLAPVDPEYTAAFASYFRSGGEESAIRAANAGGDRARIHASMSIGDPSSGGYLAPTEWDRRIHQAQTAKSPMRRLAQVQQTGVNAFTTLWNNAAWGSGWVGETAARPQTTSAGLEPITFDHGEIYAMPAATQRLIDDSDIKVEQWLADQVAEEFNRQEGIAFISGNGVNKPRGLLTYVTGGASAGVHPGGNLTVVVSGHASTIPNTDVLVDFTYGLPAPYRQNATWLMNSQTAATIAKFKDGQGNYIWRESFVIGQPATLLGRPVEIDESMPSIGAGNIPIAFGDFRAGYLINDRLGTRILRDPYSAKPFILYYCTRRVGAGLLDPNAIRLLKIAAS